MNTGAQRAGEGHEDRGFGKYEIITDLGHGGMADVYLAMLRGLAGTRKLVVIKQICPQFSEDPEFLAMFLDEARITARLGHPNVVQIYEVAEEDGHYFMAMEYLAGQPLHRVLQRLKGKGGLPLGMHLRILAETLAGLDHAHDLRDYDGAPFGVVHRDVTPQNIFVTYEGGVKLCDFGIAKARGAVSNTLVGVLKGKIAYMSPEQVAERPIDRRADLFSVGVMLWEAATGSRLWAGKSDLTIANELIAGTIPRPRDVKPDVPERLEAIILKALALDPADRHATAAELGAEIEAFLDDSGERVHARDLGQLMAQHFVAERVRVQASIERHLGAEPAPEGPPAADRPTTPDGSGAREAVAPPPIAPDAGSRGNAPGARGSAPDAVSRSNTPPPYAPRAPHGQPPAPRRSIGGWPVVAALLLGALLAPLSLGRSDPAATAAPIAAPAPVLSADAPVELEVSASPREARIFLDDEPIASNPAAIRRARDGQEHWLRFEAHGFRPRVESIHFDRSRVMEIVLEAEAATTEAIKPAPSSGSTGQATSRVRRKLDPNNPYDTTPYDF